MFGTSCCTYIPNNTAPDGSVDRALKGLEMLSLELAENSGIEDPWTSWMEGIFGRWSAYVTSFFYGHSRDPISIIVLRLLSGTVYEGTFLKGN